MVSSKISMIKGELAEQNPDAILFDGLDKAIIGIGSQYGKNIVPIYSKTQCLEILYYQHWIDTRNGDENGEDVSEGECWSMAIEWFDYNVGCLSVGENTPIIMFDYGQEFERRE